MGTLVEEILSRKTGREVRAGEIVFVDVDYMMTHDNTTPLAIKAWRGIGKPIRDKNKIVVHFDHAYPAPNVAAAAAQKGIVDFLKEQEIFNFYRQGICHQVMIEEGFITPGRVIVGGDSHTNTYGALGALAVGFGSTDIAVAWATGKTWLKVPQTICIRLKGATPKGVYAKDVMLHVVGLIGMNGATYKSMEFSGPYIDSLAMHDRIVFPNISTEAGAKCGLIAADDTTLDFLENHTGAKGPWEKTRPVDPQYEREVEIDVSVLSPQVACPASVDNVKPIGEVAGLPVDEVFIGSCTNGRYEDLEIAASILKDRRVSRFTRTIITPASQKIFDKAMENGLIKIFHEAGCFTTATGCGACIGRHGGVLAPGERSFTTMNRNFIGRMGSPEAEIYLGSPAAAAATALEGKITDPRTILGRHV